MQQAAQSEIVKAQLASPNINVFTGKSFDDKEQESDFHLESLFSIDTDMLKSAFRIDTNQINFDFNAMQMPDNIQLPPIDVRDLMSKLDISITSDQSKAMVEHLVQGYQSYLSEHPEADITQFKEHFEAYLQSSQVSTLVREKIQEFIKTNGELSVTKEQMQSLIEEVMAGYDAYAEQNKLPKPSDIQGNMADFLASEDASNILKQDLQALLKESHPEEQMNAWMQEYMQEAMDPISQALESEMQKQTAQLGDSFANAIQIDTDVFAQAIQFHMSEEELAELLSAMMTKEVTSYDNNLKKLGYADFDQPSEIAIYPKDFEGKEQVLSILDHYNETMKVQDEEKVITYTDFVGTLMSSVTDIVNVIGYVLVAFVAISLVVSSIMIGVITYISVLERKKEIGILRAIGASKSNISQVFNAETFIIGFAAGAMGIIITLLLLIPGNALIHSISKQSDIHAILPWKAGVILVLLSIILTLIGGLIPSKKAANEDPVSALRNE